MTLSTEERKLIYEEEKAKVDQENQAKLNLSISKTKPRLTSKPVLIIGGLLAAIAGSTIWYMNWIHSPEFSLQQAYEAAKKHDAAQFQKYVDLDSVTSSAFDQAVDVFFAENTDLSNSWVSGLAQGFVSMMKPTITSKLKKSILDGIAEGNVKGESLATDSGPFSSLKDVKLSTKNAESMPFRFVSVAYTKKNGKSAVVGNRLFLKRYNSDNFILPISLQEMDGYWQVTEIDGKGLYKEVKEQEEKLIASLNKPILAEITQSITAVKMPKVSRGYSDMWGISKYISVGIPFKNTSGKSIDQFTISLRTDEGSSAPDITYTAETDLQPNAQEVVTLSKEINQFIPADVRLYGADSSAYRIQVNEIRFMDGSVLKPHRMYDELQ